MIEPVRMPSPSVAEEAKNALRGLALLSRKKKNSVQVQAKGAKDVVSVPREAFELFLEILGQMANGNAVTIVPIHAELTTQQAADMLNVSRPFLVKLLDEGKLPSRKVGAHRRVRAEDLMEFRSKDEKQRKAALDELTAEAEKLGLGY
jgi:excisionase family DNA binding protein